MSVTMSVTMSETGKHPPSFFVVAETLSVALSSGLQSPGWS